MVVHVTIKLTPEAARKLRSTSSARKAWADQLRALLGAKLDLTPMHAADVGTLGSYFRVDLPDQRLAERLVNLLLSRSDVLGAYVTPKAELP